MKRVNIGHEVWLPIRNGALDYGVIPPLASRSHGRHLLGRGYLLLTNAAAAVHDTQNAGEQRRAIHKCSDQIFGINCAPRLLNAHALRLRELDK
jgi:hypothetical protein